MLMVVSTASYADRAPDPFGGDTTAITSGQIVDHWATIRIAIASDRAMVESCRLGGAGCTAALVLIGIVDDAKRQPTRLGLIGHINRAINLAITPAPGGWTGPLDVFDKLDGDCKSYGVAKYFALREAGLSHDDVRMIVVHVPQTGEDHLVIAVADAGRWLMLDNLTLALNNDQQEPQYQPLLVLDYRGVRFYEDAAGYYAGY